MNKYTFNVPNIGVVRVKADNINAAALEVLDIAGITLVGAFEHKETQPKLRLVSNKQITH